MNQVVKNIDTQLNFWVKKEMPDIKPPVSAGGPFEDDVTQKEVQESSRVMEDEEEQLHPRRHLRSSSHFNRSFNDSKTEERPCSAI